MGLPTKNTEWPPKALKAAVLPYLSRWGAWYSGDPAQLVKAYGGSGYMMPTGLAMWREKPTQYAGGLVGGMARFLWGKPQDINVPDEVRLHVPIAGDIASMSADLLFGEPPDVTFDDAPRAEAEEDEGTPTETEPPEPEPFDPNNPGVPPATPEPIPDEHAEQNEFINLLHEDGMHARLREGAEIGAAMGGVYFRAVWDTTVRPRPWVVPVYPDQAIPEWSFDQLRAVTFWEEVWREGNTVWRHLERHEVGFIRHGVYRGTPNELGEKVPLSDLPENNDMVPDINVEGQETGVIPTGIERLTAWYVPNVKPNRIWRTVPQAANWGRSDYSGIEDLMASFDEVMTSWMRDIRLGKAKIIADQAALTPLGPGGGAFIDPDRELYVGLSLGLNLEQSPITQVQFAIRYEEHERTCKALLNAILAGAGYSTITFTGETEGTAVTATEIANKAKRTLMTQDLKRSYFDPQLRDMYEVLGLLQDAVFSEAIDLTGLRLSWPDSLQPGMLELAQTIAALDAAKAISTEIKVQMVHPDWDDVQVAEEVQRIDGVQRATQMADAMARFGAAGQLTEIDEPTKQGFMNRLNGPRREPTQ